MNIPYTFSFLLFTWTICLLQQTLEQKPFHNSVDGSQTQLWAEFLVFGPVPFLAVFTTVVNMQASVQIGMIDLWL